MKLVGKILSFLAITIIIAHTVIPHIHHSEISEKEHIYQHQQAKTIFDYIALAFHSEQQGGGFEEFVQGHTYCEIVSLYSSLNLSIASRVFKSTFPVGSIFIKSF